jgi:hypothetical protein
MLPDDKRRAIFRLNFSVAHMCKLEAMLNAAKDEAKQKNEAPDPKPNLHPSPSPNQNPNPNPHSNLNPNPNPNPNQSLTAHLLDAVEAWSRALDSSAATRALAARALAAAPATPAGVASTPRGGGGGATRGGGEGGTSAAGGGCGRAEALVTDVALMTPNPNLMTPRGGECKQPGLGAPTELVAEAARAEAARAEAARAVRPNGGYRAFCAQQRETALGSQAVLEAVRWLLPLKVEPRRMTAGASLEAEAAKLTRQVSAFLGRSPTQAVVQGAGKLLRHAKALGLA